MNKLAAVLLMTTAMAVAPFAVAPAANAEICAGAHGRHVGVGGCTNIVGDVATGVAIASADNPYVIGEIPCYTVEACRTTHLPATPASSADVGLPGRRWQINR